MTSSLLRLPSPRFPADLATGDARIDGYLVRLDAALTGTAEVRRQTLLEARDFLLEAGAGASDTALQAAIDAFGPAEQVASEQRRERRRLLISTAWRAGPAFAALMLAMTVIDKGLDGTHWGVHVGIFVFNAVFFGVCMGYFAAYVMPKSMPAAADASGPGRFVVRYPVGSRRISACLLVAMGALEALLAAGLLGKGPLGDSSPALLFFLLTINLKTVLAAATSLKFGAVVEAATVTFEGLGGTTVVRRDRIVSVETPNRLVQLLWPGFGPARRVTWRDDAGKLRRRLLPQNTDVIHGDRLIAWLEDAVDRG